MATTLSFDDWLGAVGPDDPGELQALYEAVSEVTDTGLYAAKREGEKIFVTRCGETLLLASNKASHAFLRHLESLNSDSELDIDETADFWRAINNPHS